MRALFDRLQPTLPIVLANLVNIGEVAVAYQPSLEQLLVLFPQGTATTQAIGVAKANTKQDYMGDYLTLNLNLNLPPPCTTGFLPTQQQRVPALQDYPDRPAGDVYCRIPQDAPFNVRGARNLPCDGAGQTRTHGEDVRKRRDLRAAQRRLQLEGRPQRHPVRSADSPAASRRSSSSAGSGAAADRGR